MNRAIAIIVCTQLLLASCRSAKLDTRSNPSQQVMLPLDAAVAATMTKTMPPGYIVSPMKVLESSNYTEGIVFDLQGNLYFSQTKLGTITVLAADGSRRVWAKVFGANGHKMMPDGTHIVAAKNSVVQLDPNGKLVKVVADQFNGKSLIYPNDIAIDPQGGFYFTDSGDSNPHNPNGAVYYVNSAGKLNQIATGLAFANGILLTADRQRLFVAESNQNWVAVYNILSPGKLGPKKIFAKLPVKQEGQIDNQPDGMCLDASGNLFVAHYGMRQVEVLNPNGQLIRSYSSGNLTTSNCAFGGPNLDRLFVTGGIETEDGQGGIFRLDLGIPGLDIRPKR